MGGGRVYQDVQGLRAPERLALLEADRVASICLHDHDIRTVLDIGTGSGVFAEIFAALGLDVTGIDIQEPMLNTSENAEDRRGPSSLRRESGARNAAGARGGTMKKIGIIICGRYQSCSGGKCFRALRERAGAFAAYPKDEPVEIVGYSTCGGCPGGNVEYLPEEMIKNGAQVIHLATGFVVGYPPCPRIRQFKEFIEARYGIPVAVGTHPIPLKYFKVHEQLDFWRETGMEEIAGALMKEDKKIMEAYN